MIRLSVDLGPEAVRGPRITAILSPDGTRMVFTGRGKTASRQLFMRRLDQLEATPLSGTDVPGVPGATDLQLPFFSPDGEWIGFFAANKIMRVAAQGGSAVTVAEFPGAVGGLSWGDDGNIIIGSLKGLWRVASGGGTAALIKENAGPQAFPDVLPGSRAVLFNTAATTRSSDGLDNMVIAATVFETGETKTLIPGGYWPRYIKTAGNTGHLLYVHENTVYGVGFDPDRLEIRGTPVPLLGDVAAGASPEAGGGQFAFSDTGTFVYLTGRPTAVTYPVQWLTAAGVTTPLIAQPGQFDAPRLSADGKRLAYSAVGGGTNVGSLYQQRRVGLRSPTRHGYAAHVHRQRWEWHRLGARLQAHRVRRRERIMVDCCGRIGPAALAPGQDDRSTPDVICPGRPTRLLAATDTAASDARHLDDTAGLERSGAPEAREGRTLSR